jgi:hypothetical protein
MTRNLSRLLLPLAVAIALAGCDSDTVFDDGCPGDQILLYADPGCGTSAAPMCGGPAIDTCAQEFCGCDGTTIIGCGVTTRPFASRGPCADAGAPDGA